MEIVSAKVAGPAVAVVSTASLERPTVPVIDVAPLCVVAPETVNILSAEIAPLIVIVPMLSNPNVLTPHCKVRWTSPRARGPGFDFFHTRKH